MLIVESNRETLYKVLGDLFSGLKITPKALEIGVLKGKNAENIYNSLKPKSLVLLDRWSAQSISESASINANRDWVEPSETFAWYYGGPLNDQATFDKIF